MSAESVASSPSQPSKATGAPPSTATWPLGGSLLLVVIWITTRLSDAVAAAETSASWRMWRA